MSEYLQAFVNDFVNTPKAMKAMGMVPGDQRTTLLQAEAALDNNHPWIEADVVPGPWQDVVSKVGYVAEKYSGSWPANPTDIVRVNHHGHDGYLVSNWSAAVQFFDDDFTFVESITRSSANFADNRSNYTVRRIFYDQANDIVAFINNNYHVIRVYRFSTMTHLFDIGTPGSASTDPTTGNFYYPSDMVRLSNGNFLIASYYGTPAGAPNNSGWVAEYDGTTGAFIAVRLQATASPDRRYPQENAVYQPQGLRLHNGLLYVYQKYGDVIGVFDETTFEHVDVYTIDQKDGGYRCNGRFTIDTAANRLVYSNYDYHFIRGIDLATHDTVFTVGTHRYTYNNPENLQVNNFAQPSGIIVDPANPDYYLVCDYGNGGIQRVYWQTVMDVDYSFTTPAGYRVRADLFAKDWELIAGGIRRKSIPLERFNVVADKIAIPLERTRP